MQADDQDDAEAACRTWRRWITAGTVLVLVSIFVCARAQQLNQPKKRRDT
jgi:hypothetical protein